MQLYLVRHGEAQSEVTDPSNALTPKGKADAEKMAAHLAKLNTKIDLIVHSIKPRAKQTAQIFGHALKPPKGVIESTDLAALDDPMIWADRIKNVKHSVMLVGHMPYMGKLTSLLTCGFADENAFTFGTVTVACVRKDCAGNWTLSWMMGPEVV